MAFQYIKPAAAFRNKQFGQTYPTRSNPATVSQFQAELRVNSTRINDTPTRTVSKYGVIGERLPGYRYNGDSFRRALPSTLRPTQDKLPVPADFLLLRNDPFRGSYSSNISFSGHQTPKQSLEILAPQPVRYFRHALISWEKTLNDLDQQASGASDERRDPMDSRNISTRTQKHSDKYRSLLESCSGPLDSQAGLTHTEKKIDRYRALLETCLAPKDTRQGLRGAPTGRGSHLTRLQTHFPDPRRPEANQPRYWNETSRSTLHAILNH